MDNLNGSSNPRKSAHTGRPFPLPPKSITQCFDTSKSECFSESIAELEHFSVITEVHGCHQRTYSDSLLKEEVPSWLKDLLDEPETPICRSHRRSSSDSIALLQIAAEPSKRKEHDSKNTNSGSYKDSCNFKHQSDPSHIPYKDTISLDVSMNTAWESSLASLPRSRSYGSTSCYFAFPSSGSRQESDVTRSEMIEKQNKEDSEGSSLPHHCLHANPSASRTDSKRVRRYSAQQSRARKLQYIAELERNIQALQAEGSEVTAELEFLDQRNLILGMENRALNQRLDSLSQEHFIKNLEQEMLEKEVTRLRNLYQQQQHKQQQKHICRPRSKSQDLDSQFVKLSLKNKDADLQKFR